MFPRCVHQTNAALPTSSLYFKVAYQKQLDQIAWKLNTRPRKTLGWKAPAELFLPEGTFDFADYWSNIGKGTRPTVVPSAGH